MLFNSITFLVFLAVVYLLYWACGKRLQNALLLLASYVFYGWWDWRFLSLIAFSSVVDYSVGRALAGSTAPRRRRAWLGLSLATNLGLLGVFKYLNFGIETMADLLRAIGVEANLPFLSIVLPVGISFYTFQTLSYTIDVYRRRLEPENDAIAFFAFVSFFPQLVAGPIERAAHLLVQFRDARVFDRALAADGARQMLYGMFLKVVIADNCAGVVNQVYADPTTYSGWQCLLATYLFAMQIYGDFAGYSHIAIGCARLFGFDLMRNFAYPYFARSPAEFWHRWHISLSTWFRDYVYIPLGGSRTGSIVRRRINVLITFIVSGLWHGAGLTFIVWGAIHGAIVSLQWWPARTRLDAPCERSRIVPRPGDALAMFVTFHVVCLAWVFFRAPDLGTASAVYDSIASTVRDGEIPSITAVLKVGEVSVERPVLLAIAAVVYEWFLRRRPHGLAIADLHVSLRWLICAAFAASVIVLGSKNEVPFIYFQF